MGDQSIKESALAQVEIEEITSALESFKAEVAAGAATGYIGGRLIKKDGD